MRKHGLRAAASPAVLGFATIALAAAGSAPALAQDDGGMVVVTGTLIRGSAEDAPAPVDVISAEELANQGSPSALELLKNLPTANGIIGEANQFDARAQAQEGTASVNLRGLGPQRTLVLLNGRRIVQSGGNNIPIVDVALFPNTGIERIEVLKDGAAATYGSDAIGGVVNFITRTGQDGFLVSGDYRYVDGSDGDWGAAASWGKQMGAARLFVSGGYQRRSALSTLERDFTNRPYPENPQGGFTGAGNPGNFDFNATVGGVDFIADEGCTDLGGFRSLEGSSNDRCYVPYGPFGNLVEPEEKYQLFADLEIDLSDSAVLRFNGLYGHSESQLTSTPTYLSTQPPSDNAALGGGGLFVIPQYAPALIDYCATYGAESGCTVGMDGIPSAPALGYPLLFRPALASGNPLYLDRDPRGSSVADRWADFYMASAELDLELTSSLDLAASLSYSDYDRTFVGLDSFGDLFQNALAGFGGPDCAYASAASREGLSSAELAALAGTDGCTFFNPFSTAVEANSVTGQVNPNYAGSRATAFSLEPGAGLINDVATLDHFWQTFETRAHTRQWVADLVLSGLTGLELPGGEAGFAVGGQYRKDFYDRYYGPANDLDLYPCPGTPLNPDATCNPQTGSLGFIGTNRDQSVSGDVWAAFAELQLPVTDRLQAQLSARFEDYGGAVGSTFDPQMRVKFELNDWLALRGGVGTTFRGPPPQNLNGDIVALQFIGGSFRAVDLLGNPNLAPETATTYNGGVLIDSGPFRASVDYFRYDFSDAIEEEPVAGIVGAMFGASGDANCGNPDYAALEARFTFAGGTCGIANVARLRTLMFNSSDVTTSGVDFHATLEGELGEGGTIQGGVAGTYVIEYKVGDVYVEGVLVQPSFDAVGKLNYQTTAFPLPQWKGNGWLQGELGNHLLRLQLNYIGGYTDQRGASVFGPNSTALAGQAVTTGKEIEAFVTLDATWRMRLESGTTMALSLLNIFDTDPPFARLDYNYDPLTANPLGFTAKLAVSQEF